MHQPIDRFIPSHARNDYSVAKPEDVSGGLQNLKAVLSPGNVQQKPVFKSDIHSRTENKDGWKAF